MTAATAAIEVAANIATTPAATESARRIMDTSGVHGKSRNIVRLARGTSCALSQITKNARTRVAIMIAVRALLSAPWQKSTTAAAVLPSVKVAPKNFGIVNRA